jgi:UDP-N-acetylglucosamine--N-acetylmuramyl-(pentapeptide) pyrophosphoryl-undecaprenol N-acetylglucosamine transferase
MNIVIAAGGTGGHLYPAVALAEAFHQQNPDNRVTIVGTGRSLEAGILAQGTFEVERIEARGVVGRGGWGSVTALALLPQAVGQAIRLLRKRCADLVIGTGGYTSPPLVVAASLLGIPRAILEPNAMPGLANRCLGPIANRIFLAFDSAKDYFNPAKTRIVGTPVRKEFREQPPPLPSSQVNTLLVFGGSQGARAINTAMIEALKTSQILRENLHIIHQTGQNDYEEVKAAYASAGIHVEVMPFLFNMPQVLRSADLVVARSGAVTLAELAACGKPAILIPFPHATHQHQEKNARVAEAAGAAMVLLQTQLNGQRLAQEIEALVKNPDRLRTMAEQSFARRKIDAAEAMAQECCLHLVTR